MGLSRGSDLHRRLPAVGKLLTTPRLREVQATIPRSVVLKAARDVLQDIRDDLRGSTDSLKQDISEEAISELVRERALRMSIPSIRPVVNATGVILHTGLGRAVLAEPAVRAIEAVASSHSSLEVDTETGLRRERTVHLEGLLCEVTGAEAGCVVNNNAAAVVLALNTLAYEKEVIVSRGQLVEIGGSFRLPDIMRRAGARLVEVGTTNHTRISDYERAICGDTALILRVHRSNFRIIGFTSEPSIGELVSLGKKYGIPVMEDAGSGALVDLSGFGLSEEPLIQKSIRAGVDVVTFSGDKLLGGPQSGLIVGRRDLISAIAENPLSRAVRVDKLTIAALESTLRLYTDPKGILQTIPSLRYIVRPVEDITRAARTLRRRLVRSLSDKAQVGLMDGVSEVGGGTMPGVCLPTKLVCITSAVMSCTELARAFRANQPPIFGRILEDKFVLDLRTVEDREIPLILDAAIQILSPTC